jgi:hypothetical protein
VKRRTLLQATVAAGGLLAGCLEGEEDPDAGGSPTATDGGSPTGSEGGSGDDGGAGGDGEATDDESTGTGTSDDEGEETPEGTDDSPTETDEPTETPGESEGSNAMVERSFEVGGVECGQGANRADVSRGGDSVDVDGTIRGRNGCYTAELEAATYDDGADELTVAVRSYDDSDGEYCQQCLVDVDYRASFEFEDGTPGEVTVVHNGDRVTSE